MRTITPAAVSASTLPQPSFILSQGEPLHLPCHPISSLLLQTCRAACAAEIPPPERHRCRGECLSVSLCSILASSKLPGELLILLHPSVSSLLLPCPWNMSTGAVASVPAPPQPLGRLCLLRSRAFTSLRSRRGSRTTPATPLPLPSRFRPWQCTPPPLPCRAWAGTTQNMN